MQSNPSILLLCYGNPARLDDGLGPGLAREIEALGRPEVAVETNYQLSVEDAVEISRYRTVLFVDAAVGGPEPFSFRRVEAGGQLSFTSHHVEPEFLMSLARDLFWARTNAYALGIRGYEFDGFGEVLSPGARSNLQEAVKFLESLLRSGEFEEAVCGQRESRERTC